MFIRMLAFVCSISFLFTLNAMTPDSEMMSPESEAPGAYTKFRKRILPGVEKKEEVQLRAREAKYMGLERPSSVRDVASDRRAGGLRGFNVNSLNQSGVGRLY